MRKVVLDTDLFSECVKGKDQRVGKRYISRRGGCQCHGRTAQSVCKAAECVRSSLIPIFFRNVSKEKTKGSANGTSLDAVVANAMAERRNRFARRLNA